MSERPGVAICAGGHCRRHDGFAELRDELGGVASVCEVRCLDLCDSPVVVVGPGDAKPVVLRKVRTRKQRRDLVAAVGGAPLTGRLKQRRVRGKRRRKALAELARQRRKADRR